MKSVKIVKSVDYSFNTSLDGMRQLGTRAVRIPSSVNWVPICVKNHPSMVSSTKTEDGNRVVTTTLKLVTPDDLLIRRRHLVFRVTLTDGRQFLIGSDERPYAVVDVAENCPESVKDNQLNEVTVTYKCLHIPPYIKV